MKTPRQPFRVGNVVVRPDAGHLQAAGRTTKVEPRVMDVLVCLAQNAGEVVSRETLIERVWDGRPVVDDAVTRCIRALRIALGDSRDQPVFVETISKRGYRLLQPVAPLEEAQTSSQPPTLAVLPFENLTGDAEREFIADGFTELLIANLAALAGLRVISRTSVMRYRSHRSALPQIAAELNAQLIVEGSVLLSGEKLQVIVQLIDGATDVHLWADQYLQSLSSLLDLQNRITRTIAREIRVALSGPETQRLERTQPVDAEAMKVYLRAQWFLSRRTPRDCERAIEALEGCVQQAPEFAKAWAALADCCVVRALYGGGPPHAAMRRAGECSARALELDPALAEAHASRGVRLLFHDWDLDGARRALQEALARNPSHALAYVALGDAALADGQFDLALQQIDTALEIAPLDIGLNMNRGDFLITAGRCAEAVAQLRRLLEMDEGYWPARVRLAYALALEGRSSEANDLLATLAGAEPTKRLETLALVAGLAGRRVNAKRAALELERMARNDYVSPWLLARAHAAAGNEAEMLGALDRCLQERSPSMIFLRVNPVFRNWHKDARFTRLLARMRAPVSVAT